MKKVVGGADDGRTKRFGSDESHGSLLLDAGVGQASGSLIGLAGGG